jgi:pimeloyl-ACP methyl ester carboxylesterase
MKRRATSGAVALAVLLVTVATACTSGNGPTVAPKEERTGSIDWQPCDSVQCATLSVPLDRAHPDGRHISLALARRPASGKRIGVLFTNPGGPGASGISLVRAASSVFPARIRDAFDIVSWDPRGVGASTPVLCGDDLDSFYAVDRSPDTAAEIAQNVAAARAFVDACVQHSRALLPFVSTDASVADLDAIRTAMGEDTISYIGFSYGSYLGALYAAKYPSHLRAMVLDGAIDPSISYSQTTVQQSQSFDDDLGDFLEHCRSDGCGFATGGNPRAAYDSLSKLIDAEPEPATVAGEARTLGPGEFDLGVASALYGGQADWEALGAALAQASSGDGSKLLEFADQYTQRAQGGTYSNETAANYATACLDAPSPRTVKGVEQVATTAARAAPHFGASTAWLGLPCTFWPVPAQHPARAVHAPRAPPILVVGALHDPATPYVWAEGLARQLKTGHLLTAAGESHTSYGRGDACVDVAVNNYLLDLTVPAAGTRCG